MPIKHINSVGDADIRIQLQRDDRQCMLGVIDRNEPPGTNGYFAVLDRDKINELIQDLRTYRQAIYGTDA